MTLRSISDGVSGRIVGSAAQEECRQAASDIPYTRLRFGPTWREAASVQQLCGLTAFKNRKRADEVVPVLSAPLDQMPEPAKLFHRQHSTASRCSHTSHCSSSCRSLPLSLIPTCHSFSGHLASLRHLHQPSPSLCCPLAASVACSIICNCLFLSACSIGCLQLYLYLSVSHVTCRHGGLH